jgi:phenylalanyl-tRNA synthetase beta chain
MKLPYSWLKEISGVDWPVDQVENRLTLSGTAGLAAKVNPDHFRHVVIGKITRLEKHPDADKLLVTEVDTGGDKHTIICGAPNCAVGQKVVVALPGANLKGRFEVKEIKMRGVKSAGMICAEDELGLSDDHSGIMVLEDDAPLGEPVYEYLGLDEAVITFEITPNRPDCLSAIGIARELATLDGKELRLEQPKMADSGRKASDYIKVTIDDTDACPRYAARIIENVTIGPSPQWLHKRLTDCGVRPINNIVDISNYVMMETGQPLHAFDYDRFGSKEVVVRRARPGEKFTTLDNQEHELDETILLITNGKEGVAAAGVMGGLNSEVENDTKTILLESAYFNPTIIRRSARKLGLSSESSYRFERGVDPNGVVVAADRAAALMAELAGGEVAAGVVDNYAKKIDPVTLELRLHRVKKVLGIEIPPSFMEKTLKCLGMKVESGDPLKVSPPTFRPDLTREIDLIEEIGRTYGIDKIPTTVQNAGPLYTPTHRRDTIKEDLRRIMTGFGFEETLGSGMAHAGRTEQIDPGLDPIKVLNPLSDELAVMRTRMLYSLLVSAGNNIRHRNIDLKIFEIGRVYRKEAQGHIELPYLGFLLSGRTEAVYWNNKLGPADLFEAKGVLEAITDVLGVASPRPKPAPAPGYDRHQSFEILIEDKTVGYTGLVDHKAARAFDIKQNCFACELAIDRLIELYQGLKEFEPLPKFPASTRDLAVIVDQSVPAGAIREAILASGGQLVENVTVFDLFIGDPVPPGKKSLAFGLSFRSPDKTLEDEGVDQTLKRIVAHLEKSFNARLRE